MYMQDRLPELTPLFAHTVETLLLAAANIVECRVLIHTDADGTAWLRAALVSGGPLELARLKTQLCAQLPHALDLTPEQCSALCEQLQLIPLTGLPVTERGDIDETAVLQLPILEPALYQQWEQTLRPLAAPEPLAVTAHPRNVQQPQWHLSDLLPDWQAQHSSVVVSPTVDAQAAALTSDLPASLQQGEIYPLPADKPLTLPQVLQHTAQRDDVQGLRYVHLDGQDSWQSYAELQTTAATVLAHLRAAGCQPGDKVILQLDHNADFIPIFWGCLAGGLVPVPTNVPPLYEADSAAVQLLGAIWQRLGQPLIISRDGLASELRPLKAFTAHGTPQVLTVEALLQGEPDLDWHHADPDDLAILLFTSGSTGQPKGVMLTHRTLINNVASSARHNRFDQHEISLNWLHLDHVGSLVRCCIRDVYVGSQQIHAPTELFLQNPLIWLDWIDRYCVTYAWAPNFALGLINEHAAAIRRGSWDLSCVKSLLSVAEPIVPQTARKFADVLTQHGFNPEVMQAAWGMSETGAAVVFSHDYLQRLASPEQAFVEVGRPVPNFSLRLIDQQGQVVPEGTVGLLQIKGPMVTVGYYENPELTAEVFTEAGWFDTGDLGVIHDGRLTIAGRQKEMIIINGLNHYSHEIEALVEAVPGVEPSYTVACAIRRSDSNTDDLLIFLHTRATDPAAQADLIRRVQGQLVRKLGVMPAYILPVAKTEIPKSSIGKLQRNPLKQRFEAGAFNELVKHVDIILANEQTLPAWFYRQTWQAYQPPMHVNTLEAQGQCVIFIDALGLGDSLADHLMQQQACIRVEAGAEFSQISPTHYSINPEHANDYHLLFNALYAEKQPVKRILHGWQYAETEGELSTPDQLEQAQLLGLDSVTFCVQAWLAQQGEGDHTPLQFLLYASHSQALSAEEVLACERTPPQGLLKTLAHEHAQIDARHLDLSLTEHADNAGYVLRELQTPRRDVTVAWRQGVRYVSRLQAVSLNTETQQPMPLQVGGLYVLSGGLGDIGIALARQLLQDYQARVLLIGRTSLPPRAEWEALIASGDRFGPRLQALQQLEQLAGEVRYSVTDITDLTRVQAVISEAENAWHTELAGIVHLARVTHQALVSEETHDTLSAMLRPKVLGTWVLHQVVKTRPNALFIHFSSVSSIFGTYNMGAYAAANCFLDSFAAMQRQQGIKSFCFGWSIWEEVGQDRSYQLREVSRARGYHTLSTQQGLHSLLIGLAHDQPYLAVGLDGHNAWLRQHVQQPAALAWQLTAAVSGQVNLTALRQYAAKSTVLDRFQQPTQCHVQWLEQIPLTANSDPDREALAQLLQQGGRQRKVFPRDELEQQLAQIWEAVLDTHGLGIHDNFFELGGHSLLATQILFRVHAALGLNLPQRVLFEQPTIAGLAEQVRHFNNAEQQQAIVPRPATMHTVPLSFAQQRLWFLEQLEGQTAAYNIHVLLDIRGPLDRDYLHSSLNQLLQRHNVLRTRLVRADDGTAWQEITDLRQCPLQFTDLRESADPQAALAQLKITAAEQLFDLSQAPLLSLNLVQMQDQHAALLLTMHHSISDGWSIRLFCHELFQIYEALRQGKPSPLPPLAIDYADYSLWQHDYLQGDVLADKLAYWQQQLANAPAVTTLPPDRPRPAMQTYHGTEVQLLLPLTLTQQLQQLSRQSGVTLFMTLFATFQALLYRYTGQSDLVIGTPSAGRSQPQLEKLLGFFIDTVALRTPLDAIAGGDTTAADLPFNQLLSYVQQLAIGAYTHEDLPFEKLVEVLHPQRNLSYSPVFQIWFNMLNLEAAEFDLADLQIQYIPTANTLSKFDITLYLKEQSDGIELRLVYNPDLYERDRIAEFLQQYQHLLTQVALQPTHPLRLYSLRTPTAPLPDPTEPLPAQAYPTVIQQLATQAATRPQQTALISATETWDYQTLWQRCQQVAAGLQGYAPGTVVAIYGDRSAEFVAALLGCCHSGAVFTILNPSYPAHRLQTFAQTAQARVLINLMGELPPELASLNLPSLGLAELFQPVSETIAPRCELDGRAYIAFTTGSTGEAKAILGTHRPLAHFCTWYVQQFSFNEHDRFSLLSGLSHDPLLRDVFTPIYCGGTLCIPTPAAMQELQPLATWLADHAVTATHLTPAMAEVLTMTAAQPLTALRHVAFGGDLLTRHVLSHFQHLAPNVRCINGYGATETPQLMGVQVLDALPYEYAPLGRGIDGVQLLILNPFGDLAGVGERGEIYIRTPYLSQGYLNPEHTAARFIANPFRPDDSNDRLYRTGDAGFYLPDGSVAFAGRTDNQVKIRGFRIELGEIETRLRQHPHVQEAVVNPYQADEHAEKVLVAYLLASDPKQPPASSELIRLLRSQVPDYMMPAEFVVLDRLPLNPNGKVNRAELPPPNATPTPAAASGFVAPRNELEQQLATAWGKVLNHDKIGVHDNFFDLGGHSMLALRLMSHIEKHTGQTLSLSLLFQAPTIAELAEAMAQDNAEQHAVQAIQKYGNRPPLFFLSAPHYARALSNAMGNNQPFYGLNIFAFQTVPEGELDMPLVAKQFVAEMKTIQPHGPYFVGAYCGDARVGMAVVHHLAEIGEEVAFFGVIDFYRWRRKRMERHRSNVRQFGFFRYGLHKLRTRFNFSLIMKNFLIKLSQRFMGKDGADKNMPQELKTIAFIRRFEAARRRYPLRPYPGYIDFFFSEEVIPEHAPDFAALGQTGSQVHTISGFHLTLFDEPHLSELAKRMLAEMDERGG